MSGRKGWRAVGLGLLAVVLLGVGFFVWARFLAGGPVKILPGGVLSGELVSEPVTDWTFASVHQYVDVESRARLLPYSTGTWFMVLDGDLYVLLPRLFGTGLEDRLQEDPRVRLRIDEKIYAGRVIEEQDGTTLSSLLAPLLRRTMSVEVSGAARPVSTPSPLPHGGIGVYRFESGAH